MTIRTLAQTLPEHPFFEGVDDEVIELLAGCARNVHLRPDELVFRAEEPAQHFYLVKEGRVAIQVHELGGGSSIRILEASRRRCMMSATRVSTAYPTAGSASHLSRRHSASKETARVSTVALAMTSMAAFTVSPPPSKMYRG